MAFTQDEKLISVETPLGKDVLLLEAFQGHEAISRLFEFELDLLSEDKAIAPADLVGKAITFTVTQKDGGRRPFGGLVSRLAFGGLTPSGFRRYRAQVVPWLWMLSKRSNCRVFQEKSVVEIVEAVFSDAGFDDFETSGITHSYPKYEYCVQLRETDLNFVSRLLEEEGIFYYFRFEDDRQVLVLADSKAAYADCATKEVEFTDGLPTAEQVSSWEHRYEFISGKWAHSDFNFSTPKTDLFAESPTVVDLPGLDSFARYEYPGRYVDKAHGSDKAKVRMEAEESAYDLVVGAGACRDFCAGSKFTIAKHPFASEEQKAYVLTAVEHQAFEGSYSQADKSGGSSSYANQFRCIPEEVLFRPPLFTTKPIVPGPQTAVVVGPQGEEIYTDEYGRIKVQFHWDRVGAYDEKSSCWIRVAQSSAGKGWGTQTLPRVNQEVVVEFLDGDPDRPLVTGAVYNANTMPTYSLPANKTQSGIKSPSSKDAPTSDFNEIRFEDKKDSEHLYIHAQRAEHHHVGGDRYDRVGNDEHRSVVGNQLVKIEGDQSLVIEGNTLASVGGEHHLEVGGSRLEQIGGDRDVAVGGDQSVSVGGNQGLSVGGGQSTDVGGDLGVSAGSNVQLTAGSGYSVDAGSNIYIKAGANVVIEAGAMLTLKAAGAFVTIGSGGVDISGPMVKINSGGGAGSGSASKPKAPKSPATPKAPEEAKGPMAGSATQKPDAYPKKSG